MGDIRIVYKDGKQAADAYGKGLRHGLLTCQVSPPPEEGTTQTVHIELRSNLCGTTYGRDRIFFSQYFFSQRALSFCLFLLARSTVNYFL